MLLLLYFTIVIFFQLNYIYINVRGCRDECVNVAMKQLNSPEWTQQAGRTATHAAAAAAA